MKQHPVKKTCCLLTNIENFRNIPFILKYSNFWLDRRTYLVLRIWTDHLSRFIVLGYISSNQKLLYFGTKGVYVFGQKGCCCKNVKNYYIVFYLFLLSEKPLYYTISYFFYSRIDHTWFPIHLFQGWSSNHGDNLQQENICENWIHILFDSSSSPCDYYLYH